MSLDDHIVYSPGAWADIGPHVFPIEKYEGVYRRLKDEDGLTAVLEPMPASDDELRRVHSKAYLRDLDGGRHTRRTEASELPLTPEIAAFFRLVCGGTVLAARAARSPWVDDARYVEILDKAIEEVLGASQPDLVLYQAGADPYEHDQLGDFRLTLDGLRRRDESVFRACRARGIRVAVTLGGGYAEDIADTVAIHLATVRAAAHVLGGAP